MKMLVLITLLSFSGMAIAGNSGEPLSPTQVAQILAYEQLRSFLVEAEKQTNIWHAPEIKDSSAEFNPGSGYSIALHYDPKYFSDNFPNEPNRAQDFANDEVFHLAQNFVKTLVKAGKDPSMHGDSQIVQVCAEMDGPLSITGHKTVIDLGCSLYSPATDAVSLNSNMQDQ